MLKNSFIVITAMLFLITSCKKDDLVEKQIPQINDGSVPGDLKINQLQYLGSHNSYRYKTDEDIFQFIEGIAHLLPSEFDPVELDYTHIPIQDQFTYYGVRQIELDLYLDMQGGLYYNRKGYALVDKSEASGIPSLLEPGIKVLHIPDIDFNSHHLTFKETLQDIKEWSDRYPQHIPIYILLELGDNSVADVLQNVGFAEPEDWDNAAALESLENEILSVFDKSKIITPDDIRGNFATLNQAVLQGNWPSIDESRGKVMFLHNNDNIHATYTNGAPSLENKLIFTNGNPGDPDAAFVMRNGVGSSLAEIKQLVEDGYMVRTRVDGGTYEARTNDYSDWLLGLESGAHFLSTDYYKADDRAGDGIWTDFHVEFDNKLYRLNPITAW
jgi:hypothetical protein